MKGYRSARAGARRDSLALRCPVVTTQPDGPGSGLKTCPPLSRIKGNKKSRSKIKIRIGDCGV